MTSGSMRRFWQSIQMSFAAGMTSPGADYASSPKAISPKLQVTCCHMAKLAEHEPSRPVCHSHQSSDVARMRHDGRHPAAALAGAIRKSSNDHEPCMPQAPDP